jgi:hypothetical protein
MNQRSFRVLFWALALIGTTLDQVTKYAVFRWLYSSGEGTKTYEVWPGSSSSSRRTPANATRARACSPAPDVEWRGVPWSITRPLRLGGGYFGTANLGFAIVSVVAAGHRRLDLP